eukprot:865606-Amorphochlora_amoeboformis.AAC.2
MNDLSNELKRTSKGLVFATVNIEDLKNEDLLERFEIQEAPTLIFIEQAHYAKYSSRTYSKSKVKSFAQTHANTETFKPVPKPKDIIEETIGRKNGINSFPYEPGFSGDAGKNPMVWRAVRKREDLRGDCLEQVKP